MFQWVVSELLFRARTVHSFTCGYIPCLGRALCLQLRQFATSTACWAVPVLLSTCLDHDPKGKARQTLPAVFSTPWLRDRLRFVCPTIDCVVDSWDGFMLRKNTLYLKALQCSHRPLLAVSTDTCHTYDWVVTVTLWNFPVGTGIELSLRQSSWRLYASCWVSVAMSLWNVLDDGWVCSAPPVSLQWCSSVWKQIGKATCPFSKICVFSWTDPIHEGHHLSWHPAGRAGVIPGTCVNTKTFLLFSSWDACLAFSWMLVPTELLIVAAQKVHQTRCTFWAATVSSSVVTRQPKCCQVCFSSSWNWGVMGKQWDSLSSLNQLAWKRLWDHQVQSMTKHHHVN